MKKILIFILTTYITITSAAENPHQEILTPLERLLRRNATDAANQQAALKKTFELITNNLEQALHEIPNTDQNPFVAAAIQELQKNKKTDPKQ